MIVAPHGLRQLIANSGNLCPRIEAYATGGVFAGPITWKVAKIQIPAVVEALVNYGDKKSQSISRLLPSTGAMHDLNSS